ncbi:MAG: hypothetical protein UT21_C0009G0005 [Candidatus Woesebacteria bacterium GW2011_GWA1_39_11b]|nr:MAG: hypothetical protein UT21_C0009G0005 [Candidatus Woesebacteria bacterium GW2011_GWA1_39_11b]KKS76862.1 MAG: hypothetical protein UV51_C0014G0003 [Candidatus Woesebacteria bacterium GW2011_GWC1_42_9]
MKTVAIVIPTHKSHLNSSDLISIRHLKKYLNRYDKYFLVPDTINTNGYKQEGFRFIKFPSEYFTSTKTYNKLLLSENFYQTFAGYNFILVYQLDALVFSDQLLMWCNSGYDYIAAPWFKSIVGALSHKKGFPASGGNGGLCLKNIQSSLKVLKEVKKQARRSSSQDWVRKIWFFWAVIIGKSHKIWLNAPADNYPFNEDGFWALEAPKYLTGYKVAPFKVALKFAFERFPKKCFNINKRRLPFGCHAWERYDKDFWLPYIK